MTPNSHQSHLSGYDLMVIRAGGRTDAEMEEMVQSGFGLTPLRKACGFLADTLYWAVLLLEAGSRRSLEASHSRLAGAPAV